MKRTHTRIKLFNQLQLSLFQSIILTIILFYFLYYFKKQLYNNKNQKYYYIYSYLIKMLVFFRFIHSFLFKFFQSSKFIYHIASNVRFARHIISRLRYWTDLFFGWRGPTLKFALAKYHIEHTANEIDNQTNYKHDLPLFLCFLYLFIFLI